MIIKKLLNNYKVGWIPRTFDAVGLFAIVGAVLLAFGVAPALAATGVACLLVGWAVE